MHTAQPLTLRVASYRLIFNFSLQCCCGRTQVVSLVTSKPDTPFKVGAECHPAMVDPADAKGILVPLLMLPSMDEKAEDVEEFEKNLTVKNRVETFGDQVHGWMASRADLSDPHVKSEYEREYRMVLEFFHEYL
jgi:dienelactone hydrolase